MKINVIAVCKNEERILPFFLDYYSAFCDSIMVCDGHSTDGSIDIIKRYPKAQIFHLDKGDELHDGELNEIRNEFYKKFLPEYDWQIVCDVDEFLYTVDILGVLRKYQDEGVTIPKISGYQMGSKTFPQPGAILPQQIKTGIADPQWLNKNIVFNPTKVSINYVYGCHACHPTGEVKFSDKADLKLLHYRCLSYAHLIAKSTWASQRRSHYNVVQGFGVHYADFAKLSEAEYNQYVDKMVAVV